MISIFSSHNIIHPSQVLLLPLAGVFSFSGIDLNQVLRSLSHFLATKVRVVASNE